MQQLPKLVRERLKTTAPDSTHPGPDLLTAFVEHSLTGRERTQVLDHLAACGDCREVVSLTMPQAEQVAAATVPQKSAWLTWPVLRWGTIAAFVVILAAAIMLRNEHRPSAPSSAEFRAADKQAVERSQTSVPPALPSATVRPQDDLKAKPELKAPVKLASKAPPAKKLGSIGALAGAVPPKSVVRDGAPATTREAQVAAPPPSPLFDAMNELETRQTVEVTAQAAEVSSPAAAPTTTELAQLTPSKAKEPQPNSAAPTASAVLAPNGLMRNSGAGELASGRMAMRKVSVPAPRWTISSDGALERSFDSGKTWEKVTIANHSLFRAVSAIGSDVWTGGAAGALYHSVDGGQNWTAIKPSAAGTTLTGNIATIEFIDLQHGKVATTTGEIWTTSDAGQTWLKH